MSVGARLKDERKRLGLSQTALAKIGGVARSSQSYFEAGTHLPGGAYLIAINPAGVDVQFVLTGVRRQPLSQAEQVLIEKYRALTPAEQKQLQTMVNASNAKKRTQSG